MSNDDYEIEAWERLQAATQNRQIRSGPQLRSAARACMRIETRERRYINAQEKDIQFLASLFTENPL